MHLPWKLFTFKPFLYASYINVKLTFKDGKVVDVWASNDEDVLINTIKEFDGMDALGEVAFVDYDSKISNTNMVFKSTLIDENASCHLALGKGFVECSGTAHDLEGKDLLDLGINQSRIHVDFMIGTDDLEIIGETVDGRKIKILEAGNFSNKF